MTKCTGSPLRRVPPTRPAARFRSTRMTKSVLLAGESWTSMSTHIKGFDQFPTVTYHNGAAIFLDIFKDSDYVVTHMPSHEAHKPSPPPLAAFPPYTPI